MDFLIINAVSILVGAGVGLLLTIFPLAKHLQPVFKIIAGGVYVVWACGYFVGMWWLTGQTLGARVMQIRLVPAKQGRVKPVRGLVRWVGMNLSMLFLCAGYVPILFGRRGFPDWLAKTLVLDVQDQQASIAKTLAASRRAARASSPATSSKPASTSPDSDNGRGGVLG
jgi:uncharacterized RDD family membrane protein YckC